MELSRFGSSEVTPNGWVDTSVPDDRDLSQDLPSPDHPSLDHPSPDQCNGNQLERNNLLLQPVSGVEFNWKSLRSVNQCQCGSPFSFAYRKVRCLKEYVARSFCF